MKIEEVCCQQIYPSWIHQRSLSHLGRTVPRSQLVFWIISYLHVLLLMVRQLVDSFRFFSQIFIFLFFIINFLKISTGSIMFIWLPRNNNNENIRLDWPSVSQRSQYICSIALSICFDCLIQSVWNLFFGRQEEGKVCGWNPVPSPLKHTLHVLDHLIACISYKVQK